jgi:hypothetical protein
MESIVNSAVTQGLKDGIVTLFRVTVYRLPDSFRVDIEEHTPEHWRMVESNHQYPDFMSAVRRYEDIMRNFANYGWWNMEGAK